MTSTALCRRTSRSLGPMSVQKGCSSSMATIVRSFLFHYFHHTIAHLYVDRFIYAEESVARVKFTYSQGHQIGSHTWAHKILSIFISEQVNRWRGPNKLSSVSSVFSSLLPAHRMANITILFAKLRQIGIRSWSTGASIREIRLGLRLRRVMLCMISS